MNIYPLFYFPPIPWFAAACREETILLEVHQYYRKQQYTNRCFIKSATGPLPLTLPAGRKGLRVPIHDKKISYAENWQQQHWRAIRYAYNHSPYFAYYREELETCFRIEETRLAAYNMLTIQKCLELLGMEISLELSTEYRASAHYDCDYRRDFDASGREMPPWFVSHAYPQVFEPFSPGLSIIDLLCNEGPSSRLILQRSFREPTGQS